MRKALKVFSWLYWIEAIALIIAAIVSFTSTSFINEVVKTINIDFKGTDPKVVLGIAFGIAALFEILIGLGLRNVANNKSAGTLVLIILVLCTAASVVGLIKVFTATNLISALINLIVVCLVGSVRSENLKN